MKIMKVDKWRKDGVLIKRREGFYVPKEYNHWRDTGEEREERFRMDMKAVPPKISYNDTIKKWRLQFIGARQLSGTGFREFEYYFDFLQDLLDFLGVPNEFSSELREALNETTLLFRKPDFIEWYRMVRFGKED